MGNRVKHFECLTFDFTSFFKYKCLFVRLSDLLIFALMSVHVHELSSHNPNIVFKFIALIKILFSDATIQLPFFFTKEGGATGTRSFYTRLSCALA